MSMAELVITSVKVEGRTQSEVARDYKISRYWVHQLLKRFEAEGEAAFEPRSKRPHSNSRAVDPVDSVGGGRGCVGGQRDEVGQQPAPGGGTAAGESPGPRSRSFQPCESHW